MRHSGPTAHGRRSALKSGSRAPASLPASHGAAQQENGLSAASLRSLATQPAHRVCTCESGQESSSSTLPVLPKAESQGQGLPQTRSGDSPGLCAPRLLLCRNADAPGHATPSNGGRSPHSPKCCRSGEADPGDMNMGHQGPHVPVKTGNKVACRRQLCSIFPYGQKEDGPETLK